MSDANLTLLMVHARVVLMNWADGLSDSAAEEVFTDLEAGGVLQLQISSNPQPFDWCKPGVHIYLQHANRTRSLIAEFAVDQLN